MAFYVWRVWDVLPQEGEMPQTRFFSSGRCWTGTGRSPDEGCGRRAGGGNAREWSAGERGGFRRNCGGGGAAESREGKNRGVQVAPGEGFGVACGQTFFPETQRVLL